MSYSFGVRDLFSFFSSNLSIAKITGDVVTSSAVVSPFIEARDTLVAPTFITDYLAASSRSSPIL